MDKKSAQKFDTKKFLITIGYVKTFLSFYQKQKMDKKFNYLFRHTRNASNYFQKHGKKYLFGTLWAFAIVKMVLLFGWFFSTLDLGKSSAQVPTVLTKDNIVSMGCATTATYCGLYNKWITSIESDAFVNHTQLQVLSLNNNQLTSVDWVEFPDSLQELSLNNNQLTSVDRVEFPDSLQSLELSQNQLTSVDWVEFPDSLKTLYLSQNQLTSVDRVEFPDSLLELGLSQNQLTSVDWVEFPDSLQFLSLGENQLTSLDWVNFPSSLTELELSNNQLTNLSGVEFPSSLGYLDLSKNQLKNLEWVVLPSFFWYLDLSENCIDSLISQEDIELSITTNDYDDGTRMGPQYVCLWIEYNPSEITTDLVLASLTAYWPTNKVQSLLDDNGWSLSQRDEVFDKNWSYTINFWNIIDHGSNLWLNNVVVGTENEKDIYGDKKLIAEIDRILDPTLEGQTTIDTSNQQEQHSSAIFETNFYELVEQINQTDANKYPDELVEAYAYSYLRWITTMPTIEKADMYGPLTRIALAKMMSNYVLSEWLQELDTSKECKFPDVTKSLDSAYDNGMTKACQLGLMGVDITKFNPYKIVSRAEFATVLSRALRWAKYNGGVPFYTKHLQALKDKEIMTKIENPEKPELRAWTMLMLMRTRKSSIK